MRFYTISSFLMAMMFFTSTANALSPVPPQSTLLTKKKVKSVSEASLKRFTGKGAPQLKSSSTAAARLSAERAGELDAWRQVAEYFAGTSSLESDKQRALDIIKDTQLQSQLKGRVVDKKYYSDGSVDVVIEVDIGEFQNMQATPSHSVQSASKEVVVQGEVAVVAGDDKKPSTVTLDELKRAARRQAIEAGGGLSLTSSSVVKQFTLIQDDITTTASGVIIQEEWGVPVKNSTGSSWLISLKALVKPEAVPAAICAAMKAKYDPAVALVFVEKIGDEKTWSTERSEMEAMLTKALQKRCFRLVDSGIKVTEVSANGDLPQEAIAHMAKNVQAQYVILGQGKVIATDKGHTVLEGTKMNSYSVSSSLKLINLSNNAIDTVVTKHQQTPAANAQLALRGVTANEKLRRGIIEDAADELVTAIAQKWSRDAQEGSVITITVSNVQDFSTLESIQNVLSQESQGTAKRTHYADNQATFSVQSKLPVDTLATRIDNKKPGKKTGKKILKVKQASSSTLHLELR